MNPKDYTDIKFLMTILLVIVSILVMFALALKYDQYYTLGTFIFISSVISAIIGHKLFSFGRGK